MSPSTFPLGRTVTTAAVAQAVDTDLGLAAFLLVALDRHAAGDWGDLDAEDTRANERALRDGERLLSAYELPPALAEDLRDSRLWIITERDRSATTVLFPSDY